jgi:hypothetical protein
MKNALALSAAAVALLIGSGLAAPPAEAAYVVTLTQEVIGGVNEVVANGSGTIDTTDLSFNTNEPLFAGLDPSQAFIGTGPTGTLIADLYHGLTGPTSFGTGLGLDVPSSGSGDVVTVYGRFTELFVPTGYKSGHTLSDTMTFDNATFASLGATPGTYTWTWGTGAHADSFTLDIPTIPEPSTWAMMLVGFAGLAFAGWRARGGVRLAA